MPRGISCYKDQTNAKRNPALSKELLLYGRYYVEYKGLNNEIDMVSWFRGAYSHMGLHQECLISLGRVWKSVKWSNVCVCSGGGEGLGATDWHNDWAVLWIFSVFKT